MSHLSYKLPDGADWRVEMGDGEGSLCECFGISAAQLAEWHGLLCDQGRLWEVPKRMFAVHPKMCSDIGQLRPQTAMQIAAGLSAQVQGGISEREVVQILDRAKTFWQRAQEQKAREAEESKRFEEDDESVNERNERASAMLLRYGFREDDAEVRAYMIMRAGQLEPQLDSDEDRPAAMQMLRDEVSLNFSVNPSLTEVQAKIREICKQQPDERQETKLDSLHEKETELIETSGKLRKSIEDAKKSLNLGESATGRTQKKEQLQDTASFFVKAIREWKQRGDKRLIDGVFTEGEIRVLCKPFGDRPPQYTPVPALIVGTLLDGLYDPEFKQPMMKGQRNVLRKFHAAMKSSLEALEIEEHGAMENLQDDPVSSDSSVIAQPVLSGAADLPVNADGAPVEVAGADDPDAAFG